MTLDSNRLVNKWVALFIAAMASFLVPFVGSSLNVALPSLGKELQLDAIGLNWTVTSYLLAAAVFLLPFGRLADIHGRKRIFVYGIIIDAISSIFAAFAPSGILLICSRILQGIGGAMIFGTGVAIVTSVFPPSVRGKALGINAATVYIGLSLGPPIGGILTEHFGWRSIFGLDAFLGLIIVVTALWKLKGEWAGAKGEKFDAGGSVIYGFSLLAIMYGFSVLPMPLGFGLIVVGILGLVVFVLWEGKAASPILNVGIFKGNATFTMSNLAALANYCATFAVGLLLSLYLQYIKGYSAENAGLILVSQPILMAIVSPIAGRLSDKIEPRILATTGMALSTVGLVLLIFLEQNTEMSLIFIALIIQGLGFGLFSSPNTNAVMSSVEKRFYGVASGTLGTMRLMGQMLGMGVVLITFALHIGRVQITPEYYPSFLESVKTAFIVFSILCCGGVFASFARGKTRNL